MNPELTSKLSRISLMIFDVDGVLTDGKMHYGLDGELFKSFNVLDGHGIKLLKKAGVIYTVRSLCRLFFVSVSRQKGDVAMENRKKNSPLGAQNDDEALQKLAEKRMQNYKPELCISSEEVDKEFGFSEEDYKDFEKIEFE